MPSRRDTLLDAAVGVVARAGAKGLTHRAVDASAGAPQGSTSNHFRTRAALVSAIAQRLEERDAARWTDPPGTLEEVLDRLTAFAAALCADADATLARLALAQELPDHLAGGHQRLLAALREALETCGVADAVARAPLVAAFLDGLVQHTLTVRRGTPFDEDACRVGLSLLCAVAPDRPCLASHSDIC